MNALHQVCTLRPEPQTDTAPMLLFAGCQNSTALNSLHYSIRSRVEVNFVDVCGSDTRRAGLPGIAAGSSAGTVFTKTSSIQSMYPYLCTAVLGIVRCPGDNSIKLGRTDCIETAFHHNECTQHVVSLHGGHVVPSALRSSTATVRAFVVWNSWSRRFAPQMRENLLSVRIIRRQKAAT